MTETTNAQTVRTYADEVAAETYGQAFLAKEPSDLHHSLVAYISDMAGIGIDARQVQAVLALHGKWQKSEYNTNRADYRPRTLTSIAKGGKTTAEKYGADLFLEAAPVKPEAVEESTTGATEELIAQQMESMVEAEIVEAPKAAPKAPAKPKAPRKPRKTAAQRKAEAEAAAEMAGDRAAEMNAADSAA